MYNKQKKHEEYIRYKAIWNRASKKWYLKNKEKVLAKLKEDRRLRPEFWKAKRKKWYEKNKDKISDYSRIRQINIRDEILKKLGNKCAICGEKNIKYL